MAEPSSLSTQLSIESFFSETIQPSLRSIAEQGISGAVDKIDGAISLIVNGKTLYPSNIELQQLYNGLFKFKERLTWNIEQWEEFSTFVNEEDNNLISLIKKLERLNPCTLTAAATEPPATAPETSVTPIRSSDSTTSPSSLPVSPASAPAPTKPSSSTYRTYDEVMAEFDREISRVNRRDLIDVGYFMKITPFIKLIPTNLKLLETSEERQKAFFHFLTKLFTDKDDFNSYVDFIDRSGRKIFIDDIKTLVKEVNEIDPAIFTGKSLVVLINYQFFSNPDFQSLMSRPEKDWELICVAAINYAKSGNIREAERELSRRGEGWKPTHSANSIALLARTREQINRLATFFVRETLPLNLQLIAEAERTQVSDMMDTVRDQIDLARCPQYPETISDELDHLKSALEALRKGVDDWSLSRWEEFGKIVNERGASLQSLTEQLELLLSFKESEVPVPPLSSSSKLSGSSINSLSSEQINKTIISCMNDVDCDFDAYECAVNTRQILDKETRISALDTLYGCLFSDKMSQKRIEKFSEQADRILDYVDSPGFSEETRCKWYCGFTVMFAKVNEYRKAETIINEYEFFAEKNWLMNIELRELLKVAKQQVKEICSRACCSRALMHAKLGDFEFAYQLLEWVTNVPFAETILGAESTKLITVTEAQVKKLDEIASAKIAIVLEPANISTTIPASLK